MASSSSSSSSPSGDSDSDSESEILHELCNNVNLGLAKASTVGPESYKSSLSAITTGKYWRLCFGVNYISRINHFHINRSCCLYESGEHQNLVYPKNVQMRYVRTLNIDLTMSWLNILIILWFAVCFTGFTLILPIRVVILLSVWIMSESHFELRLNKR